MNAEIYVGIFWFFDNTIYGETQAIQSLTADSIGLIDTPMQHVDEWETVKHQNKKLIQTAYEDIPRGRAIYDTKQQRLVIYMDKTLFNQSTKKKIAAFFGCANKQINWLTDPHYCTDTTDLSHLFDEW